MTEGAVEVLSGVLMMGALSSQVIDYILTIKALDRGFKEVGVLNKKIVAKWGKNALPLATFIESAAVLGLFGVIAVYGGPVYASVFAGFFLAAETVNNIHSAKLLGII